LRVARGLGGLDEGAADVVIADERRLVGQTALFGVADRGRVRRIGYAEHELRGRRRALTREAASELATRAIDRATEDPAVGASEVHVLEHAALELLLLEREDRPLAGIVDRDDLARLEIALVGGADDVERAGLRAEHGR